ncbi:MAG TPA: hypothetical protein VIZ68_08085 [Thermoplasmata archaeon]
MILAAVAVAGALWWNLAHSYTSPGRPCALTCGPGTALAVGPPAESSSSGYHLYNFSVETAGAGLVWGDLGFSLTTPGGTTIAPTGTGWNSTVFDFHGEALAFYGLSAGVPSWTVGASTVPTSSQTLLLTSPPASSLSGDSFMLLGQGGGFQGSVSIFIP